MIVLFGAPGVGKGEQRNRLVRTHGYQALGTGDLCRQIIEHSVSTPCPTLLSERVAYDYARDSPQAAQLFREALANGEMAPDDAINAMVRTFLDTVELEVGCVLDGYPRKIQQAGLLTEYARKHSLYVVTIHLSIPDETPGDVTRSIDRLRQRMINGRGRHDDTPEIIGRRLQMYREVTKPALGLLSRGSNRTVIEVPALEGDVVAVSARINAALAPALQTYYAGFRQ